MRRFLGVLGLTLALLATIGKAAAPPTPDGPIDLTKPGDHFTQTSV